MEEHYNPFQAIHIKLDAILKEIKSLKSESNSPSKKEWGDIDLACKITGYKKSTIYLKVHRKEIPFHKRDGRLWFEKTELIYWIETGKQEQIKNTQR